MTERDKDRSKVQYSYEGYFDENSPRPPVPGEERNPPMEWSRHKVPSPTPRKCYCSNDPYATSSYDIDSCKTRHDKYEARTPCDNPSPSACLRWSHSLHALLEDPDGIELFRRYLQSEGRPHADALDFWFACNGLRKQKEPERVQQLVKAIYRRFFLKSALPIKDELRREVGRCVKSSSNFDPPVALFDEAQKQVEALISETTYPNFLKSEMYLSYIRTAQYPAVCSGEFSSDSSSSSSAVSARELQNFAAGVGLPTLHEDMEYVSTSAPLSHTPGTGCLSTGYHTPNVGGPVRLTKDVLLATQRRRALDSRPKPETFAGMFLYRGVGAHAVYNSYNPVSRQDSELQSLSSHSDARTESDNMSLTDNSIDGKSLPRASRRQSSMLTKQVQEQAALNKETNMHQTVIPRTQRMDTRQYHATDPLTFGPILIEKLEKVRREQESQELLSKKLMEGDSSLEDKTRVIQSNEIANAIREKLQLDDDNDQDILDQHVSRVFSDLTPSRSPGFVSPRPYSPTRNRWAQEQYARTRRKDKDVFSTFSGDSGNVHDFPESFDHKIGMVKSKSMTDYGEDKFIRGSSRRSSSKKTINDLTDSGVSVVSDTPPVKENRVLAWVIESDRSGRGTGYTHSEMSGKHSRHRKAYSGSRSSSMERNSVANSLVPAQPFVADPSMPPLPLPNTAIQLEEARRRLEDDVRTTRFRQKYESRNWYLFFKSLYFRSSNKYFPEVTQSSQSTLRKSTRTKSLPTAALTQEEYTTVVFSFCDEQFPYRTKIPGHQISLNKFKEYLPKKGNYRYFFKTECEELGNQVIQEEVSNDTDIVPLYEGKIMAQVKPVD
ncbi:axin isoform X2 [Photinus pyralis]|uniref:axin isoform X2 n=1 Tax=Photinus pyralis TaxID=7054 RepID=UPI001266FC39|nr:axin isoform X2 [Photinus pyralis]